MYFKVSVSSLKMYEVIYFCVICIMYQERACCNLNQHLYVCLSALAGKGFVKIGLGEMSIVILRQKR